MSTISDDEIRGSDMTAAEIDEFLTETGHGIFSVASGDRAYSVPISFGYDGERVFLELITFGDHSKKSEYLRDTTEACLVAAEVNDRFDWRSVVVTGPVERVSEDEAQYHRDVLDENGWFPVIYPRSEPLTEKTRVVLDPATVGGRKGVGSGAR